MNYDNAIANLANLIESPSATPDAITSAKYALLEVIHTEELAKETIGEKSEFDYMFRKQRYAGCDNENQIA